VPPEEHYFTTFNPLHRTYPLKLPTSCTTDVWRHLVNTRNIFTYLHLFTLRPLLDTQMTDGRHTLTLKLRSDDFKRDEYIRPLCCWWTITRHFDLLRWLAVIKQRLTTCLIFAVFQRRSPVRPTVHL